MTAVGGHAPESARPILERERELAELGAAAREAEAGNGSIVLIGGEAGIGKSSLVDTIRAVLPAEGRLLLGCCDDLVTPRVLGPLRDLRGQVGHAMTTALASGDRGGVGEAMIAELDWAGHATVLVVEDAHWADEATLDVLRFLVRRVEKLPAVLVLTFRDELAPDHPLRALLGLVSRVPRVRRFDLSRLSREAVGRLCAATALDPDEIFTLTSGNPFLVAEVIASGDLGRIPPSIADAVGARLSALDAASRDAVERLAVVPSAVERWLVEAVVPGGLAALGAAEERGVLSCSPARVAFRHELTRRAVVDSLPTVRRMEANQAVLAALLVRQVERGVDRSRILHHAAEVGDEATIVHFGPLAQEEAVAAGSHREAVAHGRLVLAHRPAFGAAALAQILERHGIECYAFGLAEEAVATQEEAVALQRLLGDPVALGIGLRWLSRISWWSGDRGSAAAYAAEAIEVLTDTGDEAALTLAWSNRAQLLALGGRREEAIAVGERAVAMARQLGDAGLLSHALNNVGMASWDSGLTGGREMLDESLQVALAAGEAEHACRAYVNIAWLLVFRLRLDEALALLDEAIAFADRTEFVGFLGLLHVARAMVHLRRSAWEEAQREAECGLDVSLTSRSPALSVCGLARARRGDPSGDELVAEGFGLAMRQGEAYRLGPAGSAFLEAAWLRGDLASAAEQVLPWYDELHRHGYPTVASAVGYWLRLAGHDVPIVDLDYPYVWLARGDWQRAAQAWREADCPYELALALSQSPEPADVLTALATLDEIGAAPLARVVRERLRDLGVARIPRGPVPSTRDNPAGLTDRQVQVLRLLADGLTNSEVATRLVLSVRTVDTHVAAILRKLGASTRRDAIRLAADLGLLEGARQ